MESDAALEGDASRAVKEDYARSPLGFFNHMIMFLDDDRSKIHAKICIFRQETYVTYIDYAFSL